MISAFSLLYSSTFDFTSLHLFIFCLAVASLFGKVAFPDVDNMPTNLHSYYNGHKSRMCHIHIVSRPLATRGNNKILCTPTPHIISRPIATRCNNKILCTPPPHISGYEETLPRLTCRTLAQLKTNNSQFLKSYTHKVDTKSHPSPLFPFVTQPHLHTHHVFIPRFMDRPRQSDGTAGQKSCMMDHKPEYRTPSTSKG